MVASSALFTENVYRKLWVTAASDRHYMFVGRVTSILVVIAGIVFAFSLSSVIEGLEVFWKISAMMGLAFWAGLFWRRTTAAGAWTGTLAAFVALLFTSKIKFVDRVLWDFNAAFADRLPSFMLYADPGDPSAQPHLYLPWQMILYLGTGLAALVAVSLMTKPVAKEQLDRFYACLRTPVGPDEPETAPFTLPPGVEAAPRRVLIELPGFEIPRPTPLGVAGVLVTAIVVGLFIAAVLWIFGLGV
jgi:Na+/proline symporter